jgi:mRNA-degrading endonuclease toxin of MazEF toxin-antitoxin module
VNDTFTRLEAKMVKHIITGIEIFGYHRGCVLGVEKIHTVPTRRNVRRVHNATAPEKRLTKVVQSKI